jgi:hypothetical protein
MQFRPFFKSKRKTMIDSSFNNQQQRERLWINQSTFLNNFKEVLEGNDSADQSGTLRIFQRNEQKKSLDQLVDNEITYLVKESDSPIMVLPPKYRMDAVKNICFIGNAEGLSDHPVLHKMIAHFLPKPHRINKGEVELIHWNNVFQIPQGIPAKHQLSPRQLNHIFQESGIHLAVLPLPQNRPWWRSLWEISFLWRSNVPVLVIPL